MKEKETGTKETQKEYSSNTLGLVLLSAAFLIMGALLIMVPEINIEYIFIAVCGAFIVTGIIGIVRYFRNNDFRRLESYGFSAGCILVILGICGFLRVEVITQYFAVQVGLGIILTGVIALQSALDLSRMKDPLWVPAVVLSVVMTGAGVSVLMYSGLSMNVICWIMLVDGTLSLIIIAYLAIRLHFFNRDIIKVTTQGEDGMPVVIFDMDGTLIDTEKIYRQIWPKVFSEFGYEMKDEDFLALRSLGRPYNYEYIREHFGAAAEKDYDKMKERRLTLFNNYIRENPITEKEGAAETLKRLKKKGYRLAVATATDESRTNEYLKSTGLKDYFEQIICATQVKKGKPAPDVYLEACSRMGAKPEECYAVEDGPNGLESASKAGMKVFFVPDLTGETEQTGKYSDRTFNSLSEVGDYLCSIT